MICLNRESLENVVTGDYIRSLKDLPMGRFEEVIWGDIGSNHLLDRQDRQLVYITPPHHHHHRVVVAIVVIIVKNNQILFYP